MIVFDIETGPLPWGILKDRIPSFDEEKAVPHPGTFDPMAVAIGNLKDQAKIDQKIDEARGKHALEVASIAKRRAAARNEHVAKHTERAALSATTGCVKALGWWAEGDAPMVVYAGDPPFGLREGGPQTIGADAIVCDGEADLIKVFWSGWRSAKTQALVGHNVHGFDLPFLIRRSWILGVDIPDGIQQSGGRYFSNQIIDTMTRWACGGRDFIKLDEIDRALGGPGKPDDCSGAEFATLFDNGGEDRIKALRYLVSDLAMTKRVAEAMGIL